MIKARVYVILKPSVLDPQGKAVTHSLHSLGHHNVEETRVSKYIELTFKETDKQKVLSQLEVICNKVLANPNTEIYKYELIED